MSYFIVREKGEERIKVIQISYISKSKQTFDRNLCVIIINKFIMRIHITLSLAGMEVFLDEFHEPLRSHCDRT